MFTKPFSALDKNDADIAGGKGASLGEMSQAGIPVPDGFVVLADTFERFLDSVNLQEEIETLLSKVDMDVVHTIDSASEKIQYLIKNAEVPEEIISEIQEAYSDLSAEYVAVRSSATAEDGAEHAWAGQLSSYLNVKEDEVTRKIQECWASLFTPRAIFYRFEKGLQKEKISVAVVVQKMVNSEKSGVAFSVHPVTENLNQIIIEAGIGLGEAIVSGEVTPDSYVVDKQLGKILDVNINVQTKALFRSDSSSEEGFNAWRELSGEEATSRVLDEENVIQLANLIKKIENHYGFPCDIEWAFENETFYITQSRPITTLGSGVASPTTYEKIWEAGNAPVFEMTHGTYLAYPVQKEIGLVDEEMSVVGTKEKISAYYSIDSLEKAGVDGKDFYLNCGDDFLADAYTLVDEASVFVKKYDEIQPTIDTFEITSKLLRRLFGYFNATNPQFTAKIESEAEEEIAEIVGDEYEKVFRDMCLSEKLSLIQQEQIAWMELVTTVQKDDSDTENLIRNHFQQFKYLVGDEGNAAVTLDSLHELLKTELASKVDYAKELNKFYSYSDDSIKLKQKHKDKYDFSDELLQKAEILSEVGHVRLELRSAWTAVFHLIRRQQAELSDVYNLDISVLQQYTADEKIERLKKKLPFDSRPEEFSVTIENGTCTLSFGNEAKQKEDFHVRSTVTNDGMSVVGSTAFPGVVRGKVVVIEWGAEDFEEKLQNFPEGAILVAGQTRPMLVPAIKKASAIVTDEGGITSHAAIVAREFEKPCVIGTRSATEFFRDGDSVEVDATSGVVRRLLLSSDDYVRMFAGKSFPYLMSDIFLGYYGQFGVLSVQDETSWLSLYPKSQLELSLAEGKKLYTDIDTYKKYRKGFDTYLTSSVKTLDKMLGQDELTAKDVKKYFSLITKHFSFYSKTEFFYTDLITEENIAISVKEFDKLKLEGRARLNRLIFEDDGYINSVVKKLSKQTSVSQDDLSMSSVAEIQALVSTGALVDEAVINKRRKCFVVGESIKLIGEPAQIQAKVFFDVYRSVATEIRGTTANKGIVTGTARVLIPNYEDFNKISEEVEKMSKGEILVAETTSPEIIQACNKAAAIVTNQGGMLSHAAIVSRELGIPCVIGTDRDVVLSIKTGDTVEVDATSGVVRVIKE